MAHGVAQPLATVPSEDALVRAWAPLARRIARDYYLAGGDPDDTHQEALVGLLKGLRSHRPELGALPPFLAMCIRRHLYTSVKLSRRVKHEQLTLAARDATNDDGELVPIVDLLPAPNTDPCVLLTRRETLAVLAQAAATLTPIERRALLGLTSGMSYAEIEGRPAGSGTPKWVDNAVQRGRHKLRVALAAEGLT